MSLSRFLLVLFLPVFSPSTGVPKGKGCVGTGEIERENRVSEHERHLPLFLTFEVRRKCRNRREQKKSLNAGGHERHLLFS